MRELYSYFIISVIGSLWSVSDGAIINYTQPATLNRNVILPCRLPMHESKNVNVRWYSGKDGWLTSGTNVYAHHAEIEIMKPAPNEWNLFIKKMTKSFEDTYTCKTDQNEILSLVKVIIETPPKIDELASSPKRVNVKEGENAELRCEVTGTPTPEIHWYRGSSETPTRVSGKLLKIPAIKRYAADEYICRANSSKGEAEHRIRLTVNFGPEATIMESPVYAAGAKVAVMSCVVQGSPLIAAYWRDLRGKQIKANWRYLVMQEDAGDGIPVKFLNLVIRQSVLAYKDFGNYTCVAQTDNSEARAIVELKNIADKPKEEEGKVINYN
ncbi:opioid-binding protein/cell adhesion molecule homolog [Ruditapes philippinarum]|uniref:opioid-binding protein/cell adhesion molecule homolog n=1 Tax=Ruditapes philippinarum TaxID=129788 RepID=UPI00295AEF46|nr:opioid-binding protein/cell adhesion molecule homolog [Ruditapes philippinarum]